MISVLYTDRYKRWYSKLRDRDAKVKIEARIVRIKMGNFGDVAPIGQGVSELRIHAGPGYRVYFGQDVDETVLLLCGGDKDTQQGNIAEAKELWSTYKAEKE